MKLESVSQCNHANGKLKKKTHWIQITKIVIENMTPVQEEMRDVLEDNEGMFQRNMKVLFRKKCVSFQRNIGVVLEEKLVLI